jgi:NADH dehydrogenase FAD-containing subunit
LRKQANASVLMAEVIRIDPERRLVATLDGHEHPYDYLIVATGARHAYFDHPEWEPLAPGPQEHRRRDRAAPAHPLGVRARRRRSTIPRSAPRG